jgi:hypothetical protein
LEKEACDGFWKMRILCGKLLGALLRESKLPLQAMV